MRNVAWNYTPSVATPRWKRAQRTLSVFFAWCEIRRAAKRWIRLPFGAPMSIILVLPAGGDPEAYSMAASLLFEKPVQHSDGEGQCVSVVDPTRKSAKGRDADLGTELAGKSRAVAIARHLDDVPILFRLVADETVLLEPPCARHLLAAARKVLNVPMTREQAELLEDERVDTLAATLRSGRPVSRSIAIIREIEGLRQGLPPGPTLDDLHGLGEAGDWGRELVRDVNDWRSGLIAWKDVDGGVLVSGPPGTGKTTFASALARTAGMHLVLGSLARWQAKGRLNDLLKAMREAFDEARQRAPSILFIDEVDAAGDRERFSGENAQYCAEVVAGLLECLDGAEGREGVVVIGATNRPDALDAALRRPGRLDRLVSVPLPDAPARMGILRFHAGGALDDADLAAVVGRTTGWSPALLERLVRDARRLARRARTPLSVDALQACLPPRRNLPESALHRMAVHEAGHVVAAEWVAPGSVSAVFLRADYDPNGPGVQDGGGTIQGGLDVGIQTMQDILDRVAVYLAGDVAEELLLGSRSTGSGGSPTSDLHRATIDVLRLELSYGMGRGLTYRAASDDEAALMDGLRHNPFVARTVEHRLRKERQRVAAYLSTAVDRVEGIAAALRERGALSGPDVRAIVSCRK